MKRLYRITLLVVLALAACSTDREPGELFAPDEVGILVVDASLLVGDDFPVLFLSRTLTPGAMFSANRAAVTGATVTIFGGPSDVVYEPIAPGVYGAIFGSPVVLSATTYRLEVTTSDGEVLRASTTTPDPFSVNEWVLLDDDGQSVIRRLSTFDEHGDSLYERPENQLVYQQGLLETRFARGNAIAFQIGISSLDEGSAFVIDPDFFEEDDFNDLKRDVASPPFDAVNGSVRLPWFAIYFEGRYMARVYSIDRNWFDLARTLPEFSGGGPGFGRDAGDDFDRPLFNIDGGIGLFGSAAVDTIGFTILPAD